MSSKAIWLKLLYSLQREGVLLELSKKRESFADLAPILWHSTGTVAALLQEIVSIYPLLTPPTLTAHASNRVCNALALLQCVASHPDTRQPFLAAQIPLYLYPFLNTQSKSRPFEYLRLTSLGVIGALVKVDDSDVISFLLSTEIIPLCLRIMETGDHIVCFTFCYTMLMLCLKRLLLLLPIPKRFWTFENGSYIYYPEDSVGRNWAELRLCHCWAILRCVHSFGQHGAASPGPSQRSPVEACGAVLSASRRSPSGTRSVEDVSSFLAEGWYLWSPFA